MLWCGVELAHRPCKGSILLARVGKGLRRHYLMLFTVIYTKRGYRGVWAELEGRAGATERQGCVVHMFALQCFEPGPVSPPLPPAPPAGPRGRGYSVESKKKRNTIGLLKK